MATILIVEDNPHNLKLASLLLEQAGYTILQATEAQQGIALAQQHLPDLILMDIQLPGMDGLTASHLLKQDNLTKGIRILALTAFAMKGDEEKMLAHGCDGYIAKPIRYKEFLENIATTLKSLP